MRDNTASASTKGIGSASSGRRTGRKTSKSRTTTDVRGAGAALLLPERDPIHPGEILREEFLEPLGITQTKLAADLGVPIQRVNLLIRGRRAITPDTALRLARYFGTSPGVWLNLQQTWDLWHELHGRRADEIRAIKPLAKTG